MTPRRRPRRPQPVTVAASPRFEAPAAASRRQGQPGLDRLRGGRRAVGQGFRPRGERHERRAGEEPRLRPLRQPDDQAEVPGRRQADAARRRRRADIRHDRRPEQERAPGSASRATGRSGCWCGTTPCPAGAGEVWVGSALALRRRELVGAEEAGRLRPTSSTTARPSLAGRRRPAGRLQLRPPAERATTAARTTSTPRGSRPRRHPPTSPSSSTTRQPPRPRSPRSTPTRRPTSGQIREYRVDRRRQDPAAPPRRVPPPHRDQLAQRPGRPARRRLAVRPRRRRPRLDGQRRPRQRRSATSTCGG